MHRDIAGARSLALGHGTGAGRSFVAVIGIDRYAAWPRLNNAVRDARTAASLFTELGFEEAAPPLLDEAATVEAMRRLATETLAGLGPEDSLVVFFAGHGHTHATDFENVSVKTGYLVPVEAAEPRGQTTASWLRLDSWLSDLARLRVRHLLVLIDACHSGVALNMEHRWRAAATLPARGPAVLAARRSRRVITSALDDQRAMDGGPYPGHSLFTGCLIEGFRGGLAELERPFVTGQDIGLYLRRRVGTYPPATQTPGVGVFELDDQGDIIIMLPTFTAPRPEGPPNALLQAQPPVATATLLAPPEVLDAAPAPPRSRDAHEVASRPTATQRARDREEPTSPWRRPIRAAVITKTFIAGVLAWMFVFNAIAIHEYASDGPSLYRPDGKTGTVHPDDVRLAASDAAWLVALGVAMITCYVLQRSGRFGRARRERGVAATAGRYALLCGSLALEALLTALSMTEGLADSIGAALGGSMLVGLVVAFVSYSFLTGFLAALRAK